MMRRMTENIASTPPEPASAPGTSRTASWWPRASVRVQLVSAAVLWLIGASVLLIRGIAFLHDRWIPLIIAVAVLIGLAKERYILNNYARKAVARIHTRGKAFYLGFFSVTSWLFIAAMMGGGILLRMSPLASKSDVIPWGRDVLAILYVAVGTALLMGDRIYWQAALAKTPEQLRAVETEVEQA